MERHAELGKFLMSRRARLKPAGLGLPPYGQRRRVSGLRREELAQLVGIGVDYYTRLEQGRASNVSAEILRAIADALRLRPDERDYLFNLSRPPQGPVRRRSPEVRPELQYLVDSITGIPAYVIGPYCDIVAWNRLACTLFVDFAEIPARRRTWSHLLFLDKDIQALFDDWQRGAWENVAALRMALGRDHRDPDLAALVEEMLGSSDLFRRMWDAHEVADKGFTTYLFHHPEVGDLTLAFQALALPHETGRLLVTYTPEPGSPSGETLEELIQVVRN